MKCEASKSCKNEAEYSLYRINENLSKDWLSVCKECEARIGDRNMILQGYNPRSGKFFGLEAQVK